MLFWRWLAPHMSRWEGDVVNGAAKKQATEDESALAQRLSNIEARLGVVEAALRLDTTEPVEPVPERRMSVGQFALIVVTSLVILVLGGYFALLSSNPELAKQHGAAIANALCVVHHGLPVQNPCVW